MSLYGTVIKGLVYAFLSFTFALVIYLAFWFVIRPYRKRRFFSKFPSIVSMSPKFIPFLGDYQLVNEQYLSKGKFIGRFLRDLSFDFGKKAA